jgi:(2Fe-2S) ferredoxin
MSQDPAPYYRIHAFVCTNLRDADDPRGSCAAKGSTDLLDHLKKKAKMAGLIKGVRINKAGCLDRCELGPVMVIYPEGVWYAMDSTEDVDEIIETHLVQGRRVERLLLKPEDRQRSRPMV